MKIVIITAQNEQGDIERFEFNVLSEHEGIHLWLVSYKKINDKKTINQWAHYGDNGTFIKRNKIVIPEAVQEEAFKKVRDSLFIR